MPVLFLLLAYIADMIIVRHLILCLGLLAAVPSLSQPGYLEEIRRWDSSRVAFLTGATGWLNLAGLFWLKEGRNSFGSATDNDIVFPKSSLPQKAGYFELKNGVVRMTAFPGSGILVNGNTTSEALLLHPDSTAAMVSAWGPLTWIVIKREDRYGIRLRDLEHPAVAGFRGIDRFPIDSAWRVKAYLDTTTRRFVTIDNVLGQTYTQYSPGKLRFQLQGKDHNLDALVEDDKLFIIFGDETSALTTYAAGRYMYAGLPDPAGFTVLDFNKAYNPPCAFTDFATCPLPPRQNILPLAVVAGEKDASTHH